jgi:DNA polymerase I-like protein with 3'-5' exonuclease and polymerase domains
MHSTPSDGSGSSLLAAALQFAALGYPVLPLYPPRWDDERKLWVCACPDQYKLDKRCAPAKHPIGDLVPRAHQDATTDAARITTWWTLWPDANIGVAPGPAGLIDVAPDSPVWWAEFKARGLPTTAHFASGGGDGHEHWLYLRGDMPLVRIARRGEYDVLTDGYFVAPPSRHVSGRLYVWIDQVPAVEAQTWMRQFVADYVAEREATSDETVEPAPSDVPPVNLFEERQWRAWNADVAGDRSNALVDIARMLCEAGYQDVEGIASILAERDETLGLHKYSRRRDASVRYREIARRYGRPAPRAHLSGGGSRFPPLSHGTGNHPGAQTSTPVGGSGDDDPITWRNHSETMALVPPKIEWYVDGIWGKGLITEIVAKVKVGKTTFVLGGLRAGIAGDELYCGRAVSGPLRAAYVTEEGWQTFQVAMDRYGLNDLVESDAFFTVFDFETKDVPLPTMVDSLLRHMRADDVDIVILDTLSIIAGLDEEDHSGKAAAAMAEVRRMTVEGYAVGILRHGRKTGGEVGDAGRGSSAISGYCDILLQIEPYKGDEETTNLRVLKSRSRLRVDEPLVLEFDKATERYSAVGAVQSREERLAAAILATLVEHKAFNLEAGLSANAISLATKGQRAALLRELKEMGERGDLHHADRGQAHVYWTDEPLTAHLTGAVVPLVPEPVEPVESQPPTGVAPETPSEPGGTAVSSPLKGEKTGTTRKEPTPEQVAKRAAEREARELARLEAADAAAPTLPYLVVQDDADLIAATSQLSLVACALDTETTGLNAKRDRLRTINLSDGQTHVVIDVWSVLANAESEFPWRALQSYLDEVGEVRMHTYLFDLAFLQTVGLTVEPSKILDVRTMSVVLEAQEDWLDYRLQGIAKRHLAEHVDKREQKSGWGVDNLRHAKLAYAAEDGRVTYAAGDALLRALEVDPDVELLVHCLRLERGVQAATWWLASAGAPCDVGILKDAIANQEALVAERLAELNAIVGAEGVNWRSPSQVLPILRDRGLDIASTGVDALMEAQSDDPIIDALLAYRSAGTCYGLLKRTLSSVAVDGRIYASYNPIGAQTGRTSCSEPNLQQLPHETRARSSIRPAAGRAFIRADYSQLQIVIAAWLSRDPNMIRILNTPGGDIHAATAAAAGCSRDQAKAINFGFLFGAGADTFRREQRKNGIVLSEDQAVAYRTAFFKQYAGIKRWHRSLGEWNTEAEVIDDTGSGRRRSRIFSNNVKANTPVQMGEAHGVKRALIELYNDRAAAPSAKLVMLVHDELIAECDYDDRYAVATWLKSHMVNAMQPLVDGVAVDVEVKIVESYSDEDKKRGEKVS